MSVPHLIRVFFSNSSECKHVEVSWLTDFSFCLFVVLKGRQCQNTRWPSRPRRGTTLPLRTCRCWCPERNRGRSSQKPGRRTAWWATETISFCSCHRKWLDYCCNFSWGSFPALYPLQSTQFLKYVLLKVIQIKWKWKAWSTMKTPWSPSQLLLVAAGPCCSPLQFGWLTIIGWISLFGEAGHPRKFTG